MTYADFLASKLQFKGDTGFEADLPDFLFPFQRSLVSWALKRGRAAEFVDTGLGKTPMQLVWADRVMRHTNKNVLILTPLAVAAQTILEAQKFGTIKRSRIWPRRNGTTTGRGRCLRSPKRWRKMLDKLFRMVLG